MTEAPAKETLPEENAAEEETPAAGSDTSEETTPENQPTVEENAQENQIAELSLEGEGDAVPLVEDGSISENGSLSMGRNTVKTSTEDQKYYYKFTPEVSGPYYFDEDIIIHHGFVENVETPIEDANGIMDLEQGKTYYFYFNNTDDSYDDQAEVYLIHKDALDHASISVQGSSCSIASGQIFYLPDIDCFFYYKDDSDEPYERICERDYSVSGKNGESYVFRLKREETLYSPEDDRLPEGTYTVCLCLQKDNTVIAEASDYQVNVKDIRNFTVKELQTGNSSVLTSDIWNNIYEYYTYTVTIPGKYYMNLEALGSDAVDVFYYDEEGYHEVPIEGNAVSLESRTYYFVFRAYNEIMMDKMDFDIQKTIKSFSVIKGKEKYLDFIEIPLDDWKLHIVYDDDINTVKDYCLKHLNGYHSEEEETGFYLDEYGNQLLFQITNSDGNNQEELYAGNSGKYTIKVGTDADNLSAYDIEIVEPTAADWEHNNRVLTLGANNIQYIECAYDQEDTYYIFKPTETGKYIFTDAKYSVDMDNIEIRDDYGLVFADYEYSDDYKTLTLNAQANTEYYFIPYNFENMERTITITKDGTQNHKHDYTSAITKAPTCTAAGVRTYTCKDGDDSYTESIPATGHKLTTIAGKAATCTENGLTEGQKCSVCGTVTKAQQTIPTTGHKLTTIAGKAATCTEAGLTEGQKCSVCGTVTKAQQTIPALGHSMTGWTTTQEPTVLAEGVSTRTCQRCGYAEQTAIARLAATGNLNAPNFPLKVKQSATLRVNNMAAGDSVASWTSSNTKIVTVDGNGKVTGKKKGTATVTATLASGRVLKATVKVQTGNVKTSAITVNTKNVSLSQGETFQLTSSIAPFTSKDKLSYKTSNKKVATVSKNGKITAKKAGKATITVKAGKKSVKVKVTVVGVKTADLSVNTTQLNLKVKKKATLKAYVTPKNSSEQVTYKTSNKKVATVDKKGKVTAKKAGTATITVKSGSKSVKVTVVVTK